jgi:hypothetical protein
MIAYLRLRIADWGNWGPNNVVPGLGRDGVPPPHFRRLQGTGDSR